MGTFSKENSIFFIGGNDLEMQEIRKVLAENECETYDKNLGWGAKTDDYAEEIETCIANGKTPILIELQGSENVANAVIIDHHAENSNLPASILQVLTLLGIAPTRNQLLIAANDCLYYEGMDIEGARTDEAMEIRKMDWAAQGITEEQIEECKVAAENAELLTNNLFVAKITHTSAAPVNDFLAAQHGLKRNNFVVISEDENGACTEVNLSANGLLCEAFKNAAAKLSGGYEWGGNRNYGKDNDYSAYAGCKGEATGKSGATAEWAINFCIDFLSK